MCSYHQASYLYLTSCIYAALNDAKDSFRQIKISPTAEFLQITKHIHVSFLIDILFTLIQFAC